MAYEGVQTRWSFPAGADLSSAQFTFVKLNSSGQVVPCAAATDRPIGVLQDNPKSGDRATVCSIGITKVVTGSGGALAVGQTIGTDASGDAAAITPGTDTTKYLVGVVVEASSAATEYASAWINCPSAGRAA